MFSPLPAHLWNRYTAAHLLNRAGFGGTPLEIQALEARGASGAVDSLLHANEDSEFFPVPDLPLPAERAAFQKKLKASSNEEEKKALQKAFGAYEQNSLVDLRLWWLNRMRYTSDPLREKATLFWHGHFATSNQKVGDPWMMWTQNETLRHGALGCFPDLLKAMSRDPAMIRWLDLGSSRKGHPNENFAREVMELFSLGEGHYSERDIQEAARAFTGHRISPETGDFFFAPGDADPGIKTFLGKSGCFRADDIIDLIVSQRQCARFIGKKLWSYFVSQNPGEEIVEGVADLLLKNGYDIGATLGVILRSEDFYMTDFTARQIKGPVQWLIQTTKMLEIPLPDARVIENSMVYLGQVLFAPPNVKGWDGGRSWISASSLLYRYNLAAYLLSGKARVQGSGGTKTATIPLESIVPMSKRKEMHPLLSELEFRVFNILLTLKEQAQYLDYLQKHATPYSDAVIRDLLQIMMSTPEFQLF